MNVKIPSDFEPVVQKLVSEGKFQSESDVIAEGLRLVVMRDRLHKEIQDGIDELDAGNRTEARDVYVEARKRIKAIEESR